MTEREFDELLKRALAEAGTAERESCPEDDGPMSPRQRERMERMRRDPGGYYRQYIRKEGAETAAPQPARRRRVRLLRYGTAAVIAVLLGGSALAYSLTGGRFFRQLFLREAEGDSAVSAYMDADQLLEMGGGNVGAVQETEELRLELLDAVSSGNSAMIAIRATAKQLTEFPQEGGHYGFLEVQDAFYNSEDAFTSGMEYLYDDDDPTLEKNSCILLLTYTSRAPISEGSYWVELHDFGCLDTEEVLIPGSWKLSVELGGQNGYSRTVELGETYRSGGFTYLLQQVSVTPLSLTMEFRCEGGSMECVQALWEQLDGLAIQLADGAVLDSSQFIQGRTAAGTDEGWDVTVGVEFSVPLPADSIQSLRIGEQTVELTLE